MFSKRYLGIELSRHLRFAMVNRGTGGYRVEKSFEITGFAAMSEADQSLAVADALKRHSIVQPQAILTLPASSGTVRQLTLPVEVRANLKSVVELQVESLSPWPAEDVYWDFSFEPPDKQAKTIAVSVSMVPRETVDRWSAFFRTAGLPLAGCLPAPVACAYAASAIAGSRPVVVLACDDNTVDGVLVSGGRFAHHQECGEGIEAVARNTVQTLASLLRVNPEKLAVIGHGAQAGQVLPQPITAFPPPQNFETAVISNFAAIAAGLSGFLSATRRSNLLPLHLQDRKSALQLVPTYVLGGLLLLVGTGLLVRNAYQTYQYNNALEAAIEELTSKVKELTKQDAELNALLQTEQILAGDLAAADFNLDVLKEVTAILPPDTWLSAYAYQGNTVSLTGFSNSAAEVQKLLENSPLLKNVQFSSAITRDAAQDRFSIRAEVEASR